MDLGGYVTVGPIATLNVATMAENKAAQWRPHLPTCCSGFQSMNNYPIIHICSETGCHAPAI